MAELPTGTVTFLFADVEGSTRLVQQFGEDYGALLGELRRLLRGAMAGAGGHEVDCRADELFSGLSSALGMRSRLLFRRSGCSRPAPGHRRPWCGCEWACIPGSRPSKVTPIWAWMSAVPLGSARRGTAGRSCFRKRPGSLSPAGSNCAISAPTYSPGLRAPSGSSSLSRRICAPTFRRFASRASGAGWGRSCLERRARQPSLEEAAWQVRALLPTVAEPLQRPLAELGAALFTGHRAATERRSLPAPGRPQATRPPARRAARACRGLTTGLAPKPPRSRRRSPASSG